VSALVAASLSSQLHGLLTQLKTKLSALGVKSFAVAFNAVQPGVLAIKVTTVVPHRAGAAGAKHKPPKAKPITVAVGRLTVGAAGQLKVTIRVTPAGRAALQQAAKHHKQLKLKLSESFAPSFGGQQLPAIQPTGTFSVRPHAAKKKTKK
jgi:hypothetical protein